MMIRFIRTLLLFILVLCVGGLLAGCATQTSDTITSQVSTYKEDPNAPTITLVGDSEMTVAFSSDFFDPGFEAYDKQDGDLSKRVIIAGYVDTLKEGTYTLRYAVVNSQGIRAEVERVVQVVPDDDFN